MSLFVFFLCSFAGTVIVLLVLIHTQHVHERFTGDGAQGVQKVHEKSTLRVGGIGTAIGFFVGGLLLPRVELEHWWILVFAALPAFATGLLEDVTKSVRARWRLLGTILAGLLFSVISGYRIASIGFPPVDWVLSHAWISILFTAFAIAGIANAINLIDGVHGLASGSAIIIFFAYAVVAATVGDTETEAFCLLSIGTLAGFFVLNFPLGRIFLGDAGAYATGFALAAIGVTLPARNPELSPLIGLLALSYPVMETLFSIYRRATRKGRHISEPDKLHLHSLVYRDMARRLARDVGFPGLRNPMTSVIIWGMVAWSAVLTVLFSRNSFFVLLGVTTMVLAYLALYRRVALLGANRRRSRRPISRPVARSREGAVRRMRTRLH